MSAKYYAEYESGMRAGNFRTKTAAVNFAKSQHNRGFDVRVFERIK